MIVNPATASSGPIVVGQVAGLPADHAGQLELIIERLAPARRPDVGLVADHAGRIGEIEDGHLIPLGHHLQPALAPTGRHVLLKGVKVADAGDRGKRALIGRYFSKLSPVAP